MSIVNAWFHTPSFLPKEVGNEKIITPLTVFVIVNNMFVVEGKGVGLFGCGTIATRQW